MTAAGTTAAEATAAGADGRPVVGCVLVAAGSGTRLGSARPKAFVEVAGRSLLAHACDRLLAARAGDGGPLLSCLAVVVPDGHRDEVLALLAGLRPDGHPVEVTVVVGGATRQESVARGLHGLGPGPGVVLVHDAARALAPVRLVERVAAAVRGGVVAVVPGLAVVDTVKRVGPEAPGGPEVAGTLVVRETLPRAELVQVQTPQGFDADLLRAVHAAAAGPDPSGPGAGDDAGMVEAAGHPVHVVPGDPRALKVTVPHDLLVAAALAAAGDDLL
ncbi:2-C-methyl-D-erythritol 4-phosphate cytidylyltransferase [Jannaschia sp. R86511]|uniref:IspD/TarI family cytidylyltransferase n=1 Tax=Jannaschia sp. R86511 TaxID=3093853 RepID=UPI0036D277D2